MLSEAEAKAPASEAPTDAEGSSEAPSEEEEGRADGLAVILCTAPAQQQGLVGGFLALCANEALFPRRRRAPSSCAHNSRAGA
jgi:hypothetical protein